MNSVRLPAYGQVLRVLFGALLLATGLAKLTDMGGFIDIVAAYQVLPPPLLAPAAWALAIGEVTLAVWLIVGWRLRVAASVTAALHLVYFCWIGVALARGIDIANCGCFGIFLARPLHFSTLLEDAILLVLAVALWRATLRAAR
ncbi:MAG: MauE/DoxX family redox-associated membrane protein [Pseudonocardiaceae bacterium]